MKNIDKILDFVHKTNPEMTKEELIRRMGENKLIAIALNSLANEFSS